MVSTTRKILTVLSLLFFWLGLAQCGNSNTLSSKVKMAFLPNTPVVVNAQEVLHPGQTNELDITPPWFQYGSEISNNSPNTLIVATFSFTITGYSGGFPITPFQTSIDPNTNCNSSTVDGTTGSTLSRSYIAVIPAGQIYTGLTDPLGCDDTAITNTTLETWYVQSLPAVDNFNYDANVAAVGWFTDSTGVPIERLILIGDLTTQ